MCGIVGYVGHREAVDFLIEGLGRLEYRGYDSAGVATLQQGSDFQIVKSSGRIATLAEKLTDCPVNGSVGIGHTRWATHGPPTDENAHPHLGGESELAIVHNGVIENYLGLKEQLQAEGYEFASGTDSESCASNRQLLEKATHRNQRRTGWRTRSSDQLGPTSDFAVTRHVWASRNLQVNS